MKYQDALSHLDSLQSSNIVLGTERIGAAVEAMGHPERAYPSVIIAGTNGKGSTAAFLESILRHSGKKTGLFTSPHLVDVRERIQINRELISEESFADVLCNVMKTNAPTHQRTNALTYFEFLTAMAFQCFTDQKIDYAVLEVGLGGRFDATNVVTPAVSVITRIAIDHQKHLGKTLPEIAFEKCGIIRDGVSVVTVDQEPAAMDVIRRVANEKGSDIHVVSPHEIKWELGLVGRHQEENAALAVRAAEIGVRSSEFGVRDESLIATALLSTKWPGRLETVSEKPLVVLDGAHNPNGAKALARYIVESLRGHGPKQSSALDCFTHVPATETLAGRRNDKPHVIILLGILADKDINGIIAPLKEAADEWILVKPRNHRAEDPKMIAEIINSEKTRIIEDIPTAIGEVTSSMSPDSVLIITGSLYTIGEAKRYFTI